MAISRHPLYGWTDGCESRVIQGDKRPLLALASASSTSNHRQNAMSIQLAQTLPDVEIRAIGADVEQTHTGALFAGRKVVMFAVPGAFTPTCSNRHLPGYVQHFAEFQARGIDVMCLAV